MKSKLFEIRFVTKKGGFRSYCENVIAKSKEEAIAIVRTEFESRYLRANEAAPHLFQITAGQMPFITIHKLIDMEIDIDICDDYDESCYFSYVGKTRLTAEDEREFRDIMDIKCVPWSGCFGDILLLQVSDLPDPEIVIRKLRKFFRAAAGYCSCEDYDKWFVDLDSIEEYNR